MNTLILIAAFNSGSPLSVQTGDGCSRVLGIRAASQAVIPDLGGARAVRPDVECEVQVDVFGTKMWTLVNTQAIHSVLAKAA